MICPRCQLQHQCICEHIPKLVASVPLTLLMHEREQYRATNTGRWLESALPTCRRVIWQRKRPSPQLDQIFTSSDMQPYLLFPCEHSLPLEHALDSCRATPPHFIVLDGTWQEARKMERKSTWLSHVPRVHLSPASSSQYRLRRNQQENALCTLEVVAELLAQSGYPQDAEQLHHFLKYFMNALQADKSGHALLKTHRTASQALSHRQGKQL